MLDKKNQYDLVYFEIVGYCNARCPWCMTGSKRIDETAFPSTFIEVDHFENAINYLLDNGFVCPGKCRIDLYSWGEPMLHPKLNDILRILSRNNIDFGISTNGSKAVHLDRDVLPNLCELKFSMPGFSQSSYDRVHGFRFETILHNIETLVKNIVQEGAPTRFTIAYHIYQFNVDEMRVAAEFCYENGIGFAPYCARLADYNFKKSYLDGSISRGLLEEMSKDLFLHYIDELIATMPQNYECPQFNILTIDEYCNALTCCILSKDHPEYSLGSLFELSRSEIHDMKRSRKVCADCIKSGITYWTHHTLVPKYGADFRYLARVNHMCQERDLDVQKKVLELQRKDHTINDILNSKSFRLGRTLTWPIRYMIDRFR
jgi:MoaA/NifB/PqqE/SkfB family radical SAM enzyme